MLSRLNAVCRLAVLPLCLAVLPAAADELPKPFADTSRLVSIGGSVTEIVFALGEGGWLVARDTTSTYPPEAEALPDIGYMRALSPEGVLSVAPSAILALEGSGPPEAMDVLTKASVPIVIVPDGHDRDAVVAKIRAVGAALGKDEEAEELASRVAHEIDAVQGIVEEHPNPKRILFILTAQGGRIMAAGRDTAADGMVGMAGGINVFDEFSGYKQVSQEAVVDARPDVVLMMDRGGGPGPHDAALFSNPAIAATPAGKDRALISMDGNYLLGFGPRTASAVRDLATALYGPADGN